jgi:hypothetical protein
MSRRLEAAFATVLLVTGALLVFGCLASLHVQAAQPTGGGRDDDDIRELKERVAKLEAEIAAIRRAFRQASGGISDNAVEINNVREVAKLRSADLLQRAQNTHAILREVMRSKDAGQALNIKMNDLNNDLSALWMKLAGYGLGRDPYLDNIRLSASGFSQAKPPPDYGIPGPYTAIGLPRLQERFLEASGVKGKAAEKMGSDFKKLVHSYSNPAVYQHRAFEERAYGEYREGRGLFTPQYKADLQTLDQWLTDLEAVLDKVPEFFEKAP